MTPPLRRPTEAAPPIIDADLRLSFRAFAIDQAEPCTAPASRPSVATLVRLAQIKLTAVFERVYLC